MLCCVDGDGLGEESQYQGVPPKAYRAPFRSLDRVPLRIQYSTNRVYQPTDLAVGLHS